MVCLICIPFLRDWMMRRRVLYPLGLLGILLLGSGILFLLREGDFDPQTEVLEVPILNLLGKDTSVDVDEADLIAMPPDELDRRLFSDHPPVVLDVRPRQDWLEGHLPGALSMPLEELNEQLDRLDRDAEILLVCNDGSRSKEASEILLAKGFTHIHILEGGLHAWQGAPIEACVDCPVSQAAEPSP